MVLDSLHLALWIVVVTVLIYGTFASVSLRCYFQLVMCSAVRYAVPRKVTDSLTGHTQVAQKANKEMASVSVSL